MPVHRGKAIMPSNLTHPGYHRSGQPLVRCRFMGSSDSRVSPPRPPPQKKNSTFLKTQNVSLHCRFVAWKQSTLQIKSHLLCWHCLCDPSELAQTGLLPTSARVNSSANNASRRTCLSACLHLLNQRLRVPRSRDFTPHLTGFCL